MDTVSEPISPKEAGADCILSQVTLAEGVSKESLCRTSYQISLLRINCVYYTRLRPAMKAENEAAAGEEVLQGGAKLKQLAVCRRQAARSWWCSQGPGILGPDGTVP